MILGLFTMFLGRHYGFNGGGAMSALALGISANKCWRTNKPHPALTNGPSDDHAHGVETDLAKLWRFIFQPLLFGVIGTAVSFKDVTPSTIPKSIGLLLIGICIRLPMAYVAVGGGELSRIERAFVSLAWIPKATVQAALASDPLDYIIEKKKSAEYVSWGNDILTTAVFSIILTAPLGMVIIATLGPKWLQKDQKNAIVSNVEPGDDIVQKVELVRRNSIETAARRTSEERRGSSVDGGSPFSERVADFWRDDGASSRRDQREGSVISEADSPTGLKGASASEKLVYHLATLRDFATDSANLEPEDMKLIQDASDEIEAIMREHLPRVRSVDTPGLFFRRTSATYADLDLPAPEEFIEADVEVTDPRVNSDEAV
jgi:hypothetical protein